MREEWKEGRRRGNSDRKEIKWKADNITKEGRRKWRRRKENRGGGGRGREGKGGGGEGGGGGGGVNILNNDIIN